MSESTPPRDERWSAPSQPDATSQSSWPMTPPMQTSTAMPGQEAGGYALAGFWIRLGAWLVDGVFLLVVFFVATFAGYAIGEQVGVFLTWVASAGSIVYYIWGWSAWSGGQTLGKRATNLRLVNGEGQPISKWRAAGRLLAAILSSLPLYLGYLWVAWDSKKQTWHDKIVGTYVVRVARPELRVGGGTRSASP